LSAWEAVGLVFFLILLAVAVFVGLFWVAPKWWDD
jgi:hypothetical protein